MLRNSEKTAMLLFLLFIIETQIVTPELVDDTSMMANVEYAEPVSMQDAFQIPRRRQFPISAHRSRSRIKRTTETEGERKPRQYPPFIRDTFPVEDATLSIDLPDGSKLWSNSFFGRNKPRLLLSEKPDTKSVVYSEGGRVPKFMKDRHLMNTDLLSALRELNNRLKSTKWSSLPMRSEINIPQEVLGNYLLDLLMERPNKERSQSLKTDIVTEEMILPLMWDENVSSRYMGKQPDKMPYKRTFLSQSWKPGGLPVVPSGSLSRNSSPKQGKPDPYRHDFSMTVLGPNGWRPGRKRSQDNLAKLYSSDEVGDIGDFYNVPPRMTKEMVSLHISSQNSPSKAGKDGSGVNMLLNKDVLLNEDWAEYKRPLMEKLEEKTGRKSKRDDWKIRSEERLPSV